MKKSFKLHVTEEQLARIIDLVKDDPDAPESLRSKTAAWEQSYFTDRDCEERAAA